MRVSVPTPPWRVALEALQAWIARPESQVGSRLPAPRGVAERAGVPESDAYRAYAHLRDTGVITPGDPAAGEGSRFILVSHTPTGSRYVGLVPPPPSRRRPRTSKRNAGMTCSVEHCDRAALANQMCAAHYARTRRGAVLTAPVRGHARPEDRDRATEAVLAARDRWLGGGKRVDHRVALSDEIAAALKLGVTRSEIDASVPGLSGVLFAPGRSRYAALADDVAATLSALADMARHSPEVARAGVRDPDLEAAIASAASVRGVTLAQIALATGMNRNRVNTVLERMRRERAAGITVTDRTPQQVTNEGVVCDAEGCNAPAHARRLCASHYRAELNGAARCHP